MPDPVTLSLGPGGRHRLQNEAILATTYLTLVSPLNSTVNEHEVLLLVVVWLIQGGPNHGIHYTQIDAA